MSNAVSATNRVNYQNCTTTLSPATGHQQQHRQNHEKPDCRRRFNHCHDFCDYFMQRPNP